MDGEKSATPSPPPVPSPPANDPWTTERTTYNFAVAGNKSLVQAMLSIIRDPRYDVNLDKHATHGKSTGTRGPTLLHVFARNGWLDLVVDFVGRRGIHPDETPSLEGDKAVAGVPWYTPLFHALAAGHLDVANYLVANGSDVTKRGFPAGGMMLSLTKLRGEKFDEALRLVVAALTKKLGDEEGRICAAVWQVGRWFAESVSQQKGRLMVRNPLIVSLLESVRGTIMAMGKIPKKAMDKFAECMWYISGSIEPPLNMAAKAGSLRGVILFAAVGLSEGAPVEYGPTGYTALVESCAAYSAAVTAADSHSAMRALNVAKALLGVLNVDPTKRVPALKRSPPGDVGKAAVDFLTSAPHASPMMMPMVTLLGAYGGAVTRGPGMGQPPQNVFPPGHGQPTDNVSNIQAQLLSIFPRNYADAWTGVDATKFLDDKGKGVRPSASQLG